MTKLDQDLDDIISSLISKPELLQDFKLLVDQRERYPELDKCFSRLPNSFFQKQTLLCGDFIVTYKNKLIILIERKRIDDLASSICDKRILQQTHSMKQLCAESNPVHSLSKCVFIFEIKPRSKTDYLEGFNITRRALAGTIVNKFIVDQMSVLVSFDIRFTCLLILQIVAGLIKHKPDWLQFQDPNNVDLEIAVKNMAKTKQSESSNPTQLHNIYQKCDSHKQDIDSKTSQLHVSPSGQSFIRQILTTARLGVSSAIALQQEFSSMGKFAEAIKLASDRNSLPDLKLKISKLSSEGSRAIGPKMAQLLIDNMF